MATNTLLNVGTRKNFATLGYRNFEPSGTVQYASRQTNLNFLGTIYQPGTPLPFDVGGVSYSANAMAFLRLAWDQEWLTPLS